MQQPHLIVYTIAVATDERQIAIKAPAERGGEGDGRGGAP
jgi:hypothetical protein